MYYRRVCNIARKAQIKLSEFPHWNKNEYLILAEAISDICLEECLIL